MSATCIRSSLEDRIRYYSMPDQNSGCWLWTGGLYPNGYGITNFNKGRVTQAHRASYVAFRGAIPEGMFVCHKCDVKSCVNPDHLFLGSPQDNQQDSKRKGRNTRGSRHGSAKLTEDAIPTIRALIQSGKKDAEIAPKYGVCPGAIHHIRHGRSWRHVA